MSYSKARTIVLLGAPGSGKTSLAGMFGCGEIIKTSTESPSIFRTSLIVDLAPTVVRVVDLPEGSPELCKYLVDAVGFILVYSVTDMSSFEALVEYRDRVIEAQKGDQNVAVMLIGCKVDLSDRQVSSEEGRELAAKWSYPFRELSAKDEVSVDSAFLHFVRVMRQSLSATEIKHEVIVVANALVEVRQAYNVFKKDKEMSICDVRTLFREISNPFPEAKLDQLLARVMRNSGTTSLSSSATPPIGTKFAARRVQPQGRGGSSSSVHESEGRASPRSSCAGSWPVSGVSVSFPVFLQLLCLWVESGFMNRSARIRRDFHIPSSVLRNNRVFNGEGVVTDSACAVLNQGVLEEAFRYVKKLFNLFDTNNDGQIDFQELKASLTQLTGSEPADADVQAVLQELDAAGTGALTVEEYLFVFYLLSVEDEEDESKKDETEFPPNTSDLILAIRSGYLSKKSSFMGMWIKKFCVLHRTNFHVFRSISNSNPIMVIDLSGDCYIDADEESGILTFNSRGEIFEFRAADPKEVSDWATDIRANLVSFCPS